MTRILTAILALLFTQNPGPSVTGALLSPPPCVAPTMTYRWTPTSGCSTSTVCATDQISGNNASQTSSGALPTYGATAGPNSTPALTFSGAQYIIPTAPIPANPTAFTLYAIINLSTGSVTNDMYGGVTGGLEYRINSSNNPDLTVQSIATISSGSQTLSTGTWYTEVVTFNAATVNFYHASGGTLILDNTGSPATTSITSTTNDLGAAGGIGDYFNGKIAEWGYLNSVSTASIANWSSCHYGVRLTPPKIFEDWEPIAA